MRIVEVSDVLDEVLGSGYINEEMLGLYRCEGRQITGAEGWRT